MNRILDKSSKNVNWDRVDYLLIRALKTTLIIGAVFFAAKWAYIGLSWLWGI